MSKMRLHKILCVSVLLSIYSFALLSVQNIPNNSFDKSFLKEKNNHLFSKDEKIKCDATINDDFADDSVIVIMSKEVTFKFEEYSNNYFEITNITDLRKLTNETSKIVENQLLSKDKSEISMSLSNDTDLSTTLSLVKILLVLELSEPTTRKSIKKKNSM